jgi:uncharacterized protein (UPF0262 family)
MSDDAARSAAASTIDALAVVDLSSVNEGGQVEVERTDGRIVRVDVKLSVFLTVLFGKY